MKNSNRLALIACCCSLSVVMARGQDASSPRLEQATLVEHGGTPFHLQAVITERSDPNEHIAIEMSWLSPEKWKRTIRSEEFSQTLIVNGDKVFEQDSSDYFPLAIQVLATAMVDPRPILSAIRSGDSVRTKANGSATEDGKVCFNSKMCLKLPNGLTESVCGPGRCVDFTDYHEFKGKRVARRLTYHVDPGDSLDEQITTLGELKADESQFAIAEPTPKEKQLRTAVLAESELHEMALQPMEIIWPQVLEDHQTTGETSYYVSIDRTGQVREILPLSVAVERADDSARRQIMKWKFRPLLKEGVPAQAEAALNFHFDTRAYGPAKPLTDAEVRKLATNTVEPDYPSGTVSGAMCSIRIAVDADGKLIEQIAVEGGGELGIACERAIGKWQFSPILENDNPRPYRAEVTFHRP